MRKIDISNWQSAVAEQYKVPSIPNFRVFGPDKKQLGNPTASVEAVDSLIRGERSY